MLTTHMREGKKINNNRSSNGNASSHFNFLFRNIDR